MIHPRYLQDIPLSDSSYQRRYCETHLRRVLCSKILGRVYILLHSGKRGLFGIHVDRKGPSNDHADFMQNANGSSTSGELINFVGIHPEVEGEVSIEGTGLSIT